MGWQHRPGGRDSRPSLQDCLGSRYSCCGRSAVPHTPRRPHGPGGWQGGQSPPPSHMFGPSRCRCSQPGSSAGGPHSTRPGGGAVLHSPAPPPRPRKLAPWQFGSLLGSWPPAGHSRGAAGSRPSPCSGSGSRSAPPGNWCAGHSPWCFRAGTRKPGGWASCSVRSPCPSSSYSVPCRHTCGPWGSSTGGPSSRQPGDVAEKGGLGSSWGQNTEPLPPPPRLSCSQLFPPGMTLSQRGPPVGQAEGRRQGNRSLAVCPAKMLFRHPLVLPLPRHLWGRTAAPLSRRDWTAGTGGGTAGDVITGDISLHG